MDAESVIRTVNKVRLNNGLVLVQRLVSAKGCVVLQKVQIEFQTDPYPHKMGTQALSSKKNTYDPRLAIRFTFVLMLKTGEFISALIRAPSCREHNTSD